MRSTRYGGSLTSSQKTIPPARSGANGVPSVAVSRLRQPPSSVPRTSPPSGSRSQRANGWSAG